MEHIPLKTKITAFIVFFIGVIATGLFVSAAKDTKNALKEDTLYAVLVVKDDCPDCVSMKARAKLVIDNEFPTVKLHIIDQSSMPKAYQEKEAPIMYFVYNGKLLVAIKGVGTLEAIRGIIKKLQRLTYKGL